MSRLVEVVWRDAHFDLNEPTQLVEMRTVGWLVEDEPSHVMVASERQSGEDYFRAYTAIPRACVCDIHDLGAR